ncbi:MAG: CcmD family protein [Polyangiales bacterium]
MKIAALALTLSLTLAAPLARAAANPPHPDAAGQRSMAFEPGLGDAARERVPGGRLVATAYGAVIVLIGAYVAFVARKAARVDEDLRRLEDDLARRGGDDAP